MGKLVEGIVGAVLFIGGIVVSAFTGLHFLGAAMMSVGGGLLQKSLFGPKFLDARQNGIEQNVTSTVAPLPVIYGRAKVGGVICDMRLSGTDNKVLDIVIAFGMGASLSPDGLSDLRELYFDDLLAFAADGTLQDKFKKGSTPYAALAWYNGNRTQDVDSGLSTRHSGIWTTLHRGRGVAYAVLTLTFDPDIYSSIPQITAVIDGALVPTAASNTISFSANPARCLMDYLLNNEYGLGAGRKIGGATVTQTGLQGFSAAAVTDGVWNVTAFNINGSSVGSTLTFDYGEAFEMIRCDVYNAESEDAAQWQVRYSDNGSAWTTVSGVLLKVDGRSGRNSVWWNTVGAHRYWQLYLSQTGASYYSEVEWYEAELDYAAMSAAESYCAATIEVAPDESAFITAITSQNNGGVQLNLGAAHGCTTGDKVTVGLNAGFFSSGLFTSTGVRIENRVYTVTVVDSDSIVLQGTSGYTGTYAPNSCRVGKIITVPRFECNGVVNTGDTPDNIIRELLSSCRGNLVWQGGKWRLFIRQPSSSTMTLTADDIVGPFQFSIPGIEDKFNVVECSYIKPGGNGDVTQYAVDTFYWPWAHQQNTYLSEDNGFQSKLTMDLPFTNRRGQAEHIAQVVLRESRSALMVQVECKEKALLLQCGDICQVTHDTPGWAAKPFWVLAVQATREAKVVLTLQEYDANAYSVEDAILTSSHPDTNLPNANLPPAAPTGLTLSATDEEMIVSPNGDLTTRIKVTWTGSTNPFVTRYEVQAKRAGETDYDSFGYAQRDDALFYVYPVTLNEEWFVRIRAVTTMDRVSAWVEDSVVPTQVTRPIARGMVETFEQFPGNPLRWEQYQAEGFGSSHAVRQTSDSEFGGAVLQCIGIKYWDYIENYIPLDVAMLYVMRARFRALVVDPTEGAAISLGFQFFDKDMQPVDWNGATTGNRLPVIWNARALTAGLAWIPAIGWLRGWNGAWYAPAAGVLSQSGLGSYSASAVGDGQVNATAFSTDAATAGAYLAIDLGAGVTKMFCRARIYLSAASGAAQWKLQWSDNGSTYNDITLRSGGTTWTPAVSGWNEIDWARLAAKHRYWRLYLNNTPGAGPEAHEFQLLEFYDAPVPGSGEWNASYDSPVAAPPGAAFMRPYISFAGGIDPGMSTIEVDMVEYPAPNYARFKGPLVNAKHTINVLDYGVSDNTGVTVVRTAMQTAIDALPADGGHLIIPPGTYNLGALTSGDYVCLEFGGKSNVRVTAYGARFNVTTTGTPPVLTRLIHTSSANGFFWYGGMFYDAGQDITVDWKGCDAFFLWSGSASSKGNVHLQDVYALNMNSLASIGGSQPTYRMEHVHIDGLAEHCYYGVVFQENGDMSYTRLTARDCRRAYFVYGVTGFEADIHALDTTSNHESNGLVAIHRLQRDTKAGRVRLTVTGSAEHTNAVHFTQFPTSGTGLVEDVEVDINLIGLSTPSTMFPVGFSSYTTGPTLETTTNNKWQNIRIKGDFGDYSKAANAIQINSVPNTECRLILDPSVLPWCFVGSALSGQSLFKGMCVVIGDKEHRLKVGAIGSQTITIPCAGYDSNPFLLRVQHWINDGGLAAQKATYVEDVLFAYNASGGAVGISQRSTLQNVNFGGAATITYTANGENIDVTYAGGGNYTGSGCITKMVVQRVSALAYP